MIESCSGTSTAARKTDFGEKLDRRLVWDVVLVLISIGTLVTSGVERSLFLSLRIVIVVRVFIIMSSFSSLSS